VTLKAAMTLDGRIAPAASARTAGEISWITGAESRERVQRLRHSVDAVITGIGTVLADDPLLTDRSGLARRRPLLRVVLDSKLRLPLESKLCGSADGDVVVFCSEASPDRLEAFADRGIDARAIAPEGGESRASLAAILKALGEMGITSAMVEAGSGWSTGCSSFMRRGFWGRRVSLCFPRRHRKSSRRGDRPCIDSGRILLLRDA
jgi:diaminohydroxyphosphoribosylaminopyrimidine deaminase/5-amino-6-(5-phosphoribosylamino)uracil reductase